jgi:hypothetical protein
VSLYTDLVCQALGQKLPLVRGPAALVSGVARAVTHKLMPPPELGTIPKENNRWLW